MNLTRIALRNAQFVLIVLLIGVVLATRSFMTMPRSEDPQVSFPIYVLSVVYPGTSPEDMETLIVDPLEEVINEIDEITRIETKITEGVVIISIEAEFGLDTEEKFDEIVREVNTVRPTLPQGIVLFNIEQIKPEDRVSFVLFSLSSEVAPYDKLYDFAEDLEDDLEKVDGISDIDIEAYPEEEVRISLDFQRMAAQNISLAQVIGTLNAYNINIPGGEVSAGTKNFAIQSSGGYDNIEEIKNTVVTAGDNRVVYLKDIATVKIENEDVLWKAKFNKAKSIFVALKLKRGVNIIDVDAEVQAVANEFRSDLPPNVFLNTSFEQASAVKARINDFFQNLLQGIALVGLVILFFLGWRASFIIITLIPLCAILALAVLNSSGYGLQQISVASLVLALGLLVDNGIVVIENISRFIKEGLSKKEASFKGATEVGTAVASSTVTTLLSFFPLSQLGGGPGLFLISLPLTVIYTLVISLILALSFSPIMSRWVLRDTNEDGPSFADRIFDGFIKRVYRPVLEFSLRKGWIIIILAIAVTGFSVSLFPKIGVSFFPTADKNLLLIDINGPRGSSLEHTERAVNFVESILDTLDIVEDYTSNVGHGNPQIYYNRIPKQYLKQHGQILANLKYWENQSFYSTIAQLRRDFANYPGAKITVEELKNGAPVAAPIEIRVIGDDLDILKDLCQQVENILRNTNGVINIENPLRRNQTNLFIELDKEKAGLLNVSELDFDRTIRASLNGLQIDQVTLDDDEDYALVLRMPFNNQPKLDDFNKIYISNRLGGQIPLLHIAKVRFEGGPAEFAHYDLDRFAGVTGSVVNLDETIPKTLEVIDKLDAMDWPKDYEYMIGGEYEEQQSTFGNLGVILVLAQIAIFAVLVLQFRSILQPFIVFSAIPLAISGSFVALYLTGWPFSFFAFVGLVSLIGIVVNNSIIMVDYINQLIESGEDKLDAIILGSTRRFKPILLTTMTTILGLLPLALQKTNQWSPLCMTIIGGMISSTVLTLVVVPILYKWFTKERKPVTVQS